PFEYLKDNMTELLANMDMAANRIARIVTDLKNFSRRSSVTERVPVDLNTAVENALRLAQTTLKKSGVNLALDLSGGLPPVTANLQNLEQIALNLLINAVQAVEAEKGGRVCLSTSMLKDGRVALEVADNGNGIPDRIAERVFDPFVTDRLDQGGTGLGLSVTYNLVKAHGGEISFESSPAKGTTFKVAFPKAEISDGAAPLYTDNAWASDNKR
ncbi:MAG: sensor histidine kinase, partial [Desulfobacteraceae bacterium]